MTRRAPGLLSTSTQSALDSHVCLAPSTEAQSQEKGRAEPLQATPWAVDPVGGRRITGPRGGSVWEERGDCHPCVERVCTLPQHRVRYVVGLLKQVSPITSLSLFLPASFTSSLPPQSAPHFPRGSPLTPALGLPLLRPSLLKTSVLSPGPRLPGGGACPGSQPTLL